MLFINITHRRLTKELSNSSTTITSIIIRICCSINECAQNMDHPSKKGYFFLWRSIQYLIDNETQ
jgi:hypothetical protein